MRGRAIIFSICCAAVTGCSSEVKHVAATQPSVSLETYYEPSHASALAFAPALAAADAPMDLSRAGRERSAFVGYDDLIRTFIYVRTDDRFTGNGEGNYERRAITEKVASSTR